MLAGFRPLPKSTRGSSTPPNGDGYVDFSVKLKSGLALGTQISNKATIVFDANASIDTPAWTNTVIVRSSKPLNVTGPGSFTYDPTTSAFLNGLAVGQTAIELVGTTTMDGQVAANTVAFDTETWVVVN